MNINIKSLKVTILIGMALIVCTTCTYCPENVMEIQDNNSYNYLDTKTFRVYITDNDKTGTQWQGYNGVSEEIHDGDRSPDQVGDQGLRHD